MGSTGKSTTSAGAGTGMTGATAAGSATPTPQTSPQGSIQPGDTPQSVPTATQAQSANNANFDANNDQPYTGQLRQYYQQQTFGIDTQLAIQDYLYDKPVGNLWSPSQNMNYLMKYGKDDQMSPQEKFMKQGMLDGMHNLGYNMDLEHYGRISFVDNFGQLAQQMGNTTTPITSSNFEKMSEADLKKAFNGVDFTYSAFMSTSCNSFAHAPNGGKPFTDKAVKLNIKAPARAQGMMPGNGPGGALGEIVLAPNQHFRITDVRFTNKMGRSASSTYKQIEFDVEII